MVKGLPSYYIFQLLPCYKKECIHPICERGRPQKELTWYEDGPPLSYLPIPIPDPKRCWGQPCTRCKGFCTGHYLMPDEHLDYITKYGTDKCVYSPPKDQLEKAAKSKIGQRTATNTYVKMFFFPQMNARIWTAHVELTAERRKAGAKKRLLLGQGKESLTKVIMYFSSNPFNLRVY